MSGWISIHRKIQDHWLWEDGTFDKRSAWIDLLLLVNHEERKILFDNDLKTIKRGQRIISMQQLQERWKWSNTKVRNFLKLLEKDNMIKLEIAPRKYTLVTIVNYSDYQNIKNKKHHRNITEAPEEHHESTTEASQEHINNNDNNDNNVCMYDGKMKRIINLLENNLGIVPPILRDEISKYSKTFNEDMFSEAIKIAANNKKRTVNYVLGVLRNWRDNNILTIDDLEALRREKELEREKESQKKAYNSPIKKTRFHNFKQQSDKYTSNELEDVASRKRQKHLESLKRLSGE